MKDRSLPNGRDISWSATFRGARVPSLGQTRGGRGAGANLPPAGTAFKKRSEAPPLLPRHLEPCKLRVDDLLEPLEGLRAGDLLTVDHEDGRTFELEALRQSQVFLDAGLELRVLLSRPEAFQTESHRIRVGL